MSKYNTGSSFRVQEFFSKGKAPLKSGLVSTHWPPESRTRPLSLFAYLGSIWIPRVFVLEGSKSCIRKCVSLAAQSPHPRLVSVDRWLPGGTPRPSTWKTGTDSSVHPTVSTWALPRLGWTLGTRGRSLRTVSRPRPGQSHHWTRTRESRCGTARWPSRPRAHGCSWSAGPWW